MFHSVTEHGALFRHFEVSAGRTNTTGRTVSCAPALSMLHGAGYRRNFTPAAIAVLSMSSQAGGIAPFVCVCGRKLLFQDVKRTVRRSTVCGAAGITPPERETALSFAGGRRQRFSETERENGYDSRNGGARFCDSMLLQGSRAGPKRARRRRVLAAVTRKNTDFFAALTRMRPWRGREKREDKPCSWLTANFF